jgi:hypothetical protein
MALPATPRTAPTHRGGPAYPHSPPGLMWPGVGPVSLVGPHCYQDSGGNLHIDIPALRIHLEVYPPGGPSSEEIFARIADAVRQAAR